VIYCILLLAVLKAFDATLTLAWYLRRHSVYRYGGGRELIISERLKEELRAGKTLRGAIEAGFKRAWTAILDSKRLLHPDPVCASIGWNRPVKGFCDHANYRCCGSACYCGDVNAALHGYHSRYEVEQHDRRSSGVSEESMAR